MEWDLKIPSWDFGELDRAAGSSIGSSVIITPGGKSGLGRQGSGMDCSVDLKLGGLGDSRAPAKWEQRPPSHLVRTSSAVPATGAPVSGLPKRARALSGGTQNASCLVDGCKADLSNCREYHRRHKVCEAHSKTPVVLIGGQEQRFCQQCSRFHSLVEFDEVKRSCRKRLDGHNRRRRKPQPEPLSSGLFSIHQGTRFASYPHIFPSAVPDSCWPSTIKLEDESLFNHLQPLQVLERRQEIPGTFRIYKEGKQFPFSHDNDVAVISRTKQETSVSQALLSAVPASEINSRKFSNSMAHVVDSDCALSLLSSATQTTTISLDHMVPADQIPFGQPLVQNLQQYGNLGRFTQSQTSNSVAPTSLSYLRMNDEQVSPVLVSTEAACLNCHDVYHVGCEGSSVIQPQALPFSWQ